MARPLVWPRSASRIAIARGERRAQVPGPLGEVALVQVVRPYAPLQEPLEEVLQDPRARSSRRAKERSGSRRGRPRRRASRTRARASSVHSFGWLKWVTTKSGACRRRSAASRASMRIGRTAGARVASRTTFTCGTERTAVSSASSRSSSSTSGSPPDTMTSRIDGRARRTSTAASRSARERRAIAGEGDAAAGAVAAVDGAAIGREEQRAIRVAVHDGSRRDGGCPPRAGRGGRPACARTPQRSGSPGSAPGRRGAPRR